MKIIPLIGRMILLNKCSFNTVRIANHLLLESNVKTFNQSLYFNINTFHALNATETTSVKNERKSKAKKKKDSGNSEGNKKVNETKTKLKSLTVKPEISPHDLEIKLRQIGKLVNKGVTFILKVEVSPKIENGLELIFTEAQNMISLNNISATLSKGKNCINFYPLKANEKGNENQDQTPKDDGSS